MGKFLDTLPAFLKFAESVCHLMWLRQSTLELYASSVLGFHGIDSTLFTNSCDDTTDGDYLPNQQHDEESTGPDRFLASLHIHLH